MIFPQKLLAALEKEMGWERKALAKAAAALSARYRGEREVLAGRYATSDEDVAAYAAFRMPATYAAARAVFVEVAERLPGYSPRSLLDVGAGPGTVMWAAAEVWPGIESVTIVEREGAMIRLGRRLAAAASAALRNAVWIQQDATGRWDAPSADLVVASYLLGELQPAAAGPLVERLWEKTRGILVLIEPGTPAGSARIVQARERLIAQGAHVVAPCPHPRKCPLGDGDWCHFAQRLPRTRWHREVKQGVLAYEDEKYSYVAVSRIPARPASGRVIRHPRVHKGHVELTLCTLDGFESAVVSRKEGDRYRWARKARWGSALPDGDEVDRGLERSAFSSEDEGQQV